MGQTLSEPVTTKETSKCENSYAKVASSCMQGWRINMEDAHIHLLSLPGDKDSCFFGVFDGHGGVKVAQYAGINLHKKILAQSTYAQGNVAEALRSGFLSLDEEMMKDETMKDELAGTTAVVALIKNNKIYCANVGDSRAVASVGGEVEQLSFDHKPGNEQETRRIIAAGGWVEFNRVNGNLALSRALGDFVFKKNDKKRAEEQIVTGKIALLFPHVNWEHGLHALVVPGSAGFKCQMLLVMIVVCEHPFSGFTKVVSDYDTVISLKNNTMWRTVFPRLNDGARINAG